ncbi:MAG: hypothetical protein IPL88_10850 [Rhizobiales bacterium]|nr:hypothetical protein [Hyphomicrobiales bacterium]
MARMGALSAAARDVERSPFLTRILPVRVEAASAAGDPAAAIAAGIERAMRRADRDWAALADEAAFALADPQAAAREAGERFDALRRRLDEETRELDDAKGKRARLPDLLLYETAGSKVDSFARGNRSRLETALRRFGFSEADATVAYKNLVGEVTELGGAASATPTLLRSIWAFRGQTRLLVIAALLVLLWIAFGMAQDSQGAWGPWLREQGGLGVAVAEWAAKGWLATFGRVALAGAGLALVVNVWRAVRFTAPILRGAKLLKADLAERSVELDRQIEARASRIEALLAEAEAARKAAETTTQRAASLGARAAAPSALAVDSRADGFVAALDEALARNPARARVIVAVDGLDDVPAEAARRVLDAARRLLAGPHYAVLAGLDPALGALGATPEARRDGFARLFQAAWRLEPGAGFDPERAIAAHLTGAETAAPPAPAPDAARSLLDEPINMAESDLIARLAPLAGATPRQMKRFANLYRLGRLASPNRSALALMLAAELGAAGDPLAVNAALDEGREPDGDPRLIGAVRAARAAAGGGIKPADLYAARRLVRRFTALEEGA